MEPFSSAKPKGTLSDDEVLGNMFVIMAAGHGELES